MDLIQLIIVLVVVGVLMWMINSFVPMEARIKNVLNIVVVIAVVLWVISLFFDLSSIRTIRVGR
jgi:hypothetical protein